MVVRRKRLTRFFSLLTFYCVSAMLVYYFITQAHTGKRGMEAKTSLNQQLVVLKDELKELKSEHKEWKHRLSLLKSENVDRDLLEERARVVLGHVHPNDVVIMLNQP